MNCLRLQGENTLVGMLSEVQSAIQVLKQVSLQNATMANPYVFFTIANQDILTTALTRSLRMRLENFIRESSKVDKTVCAGVETSSDCRHLARAVAVSSVTHRKAKAHCCQEAPLCFLLPLASQVFKLAIIILVAEILLVIVPIVLKVCEGCPVCASSQQSAVPPYCWRHPMFSSSSCEAGVLFCRVRTGTRNRCCFFSCGLNRWKRTSSLCWVCYCTCLPLS